MSQFRCPGQDMRFWKPKDIFESKCPHCGAAIEFWKDDPKRKCRQCGQMVRNPKIDLGCAKWCKYAAQCLGEDAAAIREASLCQDLLAEMKQLFGKDERRIRHAEAVLDYAEKILDAEGGDPLVVKAAAILHDIGIHEAERKHGSPAGKYQEIEGPLIARRILEKHGVDSEYIEHICRIVGSHHSARDIDTREFRIVWDADWLVNIPEECAGKSRDELEEFIKRTFRTKAGRDMALARYVT